VLEIRENEGGIVQAGTSLLSLELTQEDLQVVLYLSPADGASVRPGMAVQIAPATVRPEEYGVLLGKVVSVSQFPATYQGMLRAWAAMIGRCCRAVARWLKRGRADQSGDSEGYQWSSPKGPSVPIQSGTFCTASIVIDEQHPIGLIFDTVR
jgi:HlyD family secretion protein